jgi:nucleotide-binding universal stress UspA family protein
MTRILLATHGGTGADGAARVAVLLSERLQAELDAVVVQEPLLPLDYGYGIIWAPSTEQMEAVAQQLSTDAAAQLRRCNAPRCAPSLRVGPPVMEIVATARADQAAVVVLGLGPHDLMDRALGRETALQLVQVAATPVLAVPPDVTALPRRVVAAVDFTPTSVRAAQLAAGWLRDGDALHLVHIAEEASGAADRAAAEQKLGGVASGLRVGGRVEVKQAVVSGAPAPALLDYASREGAELIALGSHGYGLWKRLTIGSVASKVLRLARLSVLVVPIGSLGVPHR